MVCGASASWLVRPAAPQEGRLFEGMLAGKWAATGASAGLSECSELLCRVSGLCFVSELCASRKSQRVNMRGSGRPPLTCIQET